MGSGPGMLNKLRLAFDLTLITFLLFFAIQHYWSGSLFFIVEVIIILLLSALQIVRWQINKEMCELEQQFNEMYQQYLEVTGYGNGKGEYEVKQK